MIPELGHFALILAFVTAAVLGSLPLLGAQRGDAALMAVARPAARAQFVLVLVAFACLAWAFVDNDFSVAYVASHSNTQLPLVYRLTAVWGSHEGSLLLWGLMLTGWTAAVSFSKRLPEVFSARVLAVLGLVSVGFMAFMLITSNPFTRLLPGAPEGNDLNPLLQDPGMIIHPPLLYMGYVGFSVAFAFAIAALIGGQFDVAWARLSRPWTLTAWLFLTLGIAVGSGWAYYELGWGGWWFWDPVENASFMPWLVGTALIHSLAVTEKRGAFKSWTVLLAISAFSLSLLGTFLVRSGVLTSVHAFATDPKRGVFILALLVIVIGGSLALYAWRAPKLAGGGRFGLLSRETLLLTNNVLLAVVCATVLLGTLYPLLMDALGGGKLSVGPPYFEAVFVPLMAPVVLLMVVSPFVRWKDHAFGTLVSRLWPAFAGSLLAGALLAWLSGHPSWRSTLGLALAAWVLAGNVQLLWARMQGEDGLWARLSGIPGSWWGMWLAHLGIGIFIIGVTLVKTLEANVDVTVKIGSNTQLAGYDFRLDGVNEVKGPNYVAAQATVSLARDGRQINVLHPEKRIYTARQMPMTESSIDTGLFRDVYVSLGEAVGPDSWVLRLYYKPFVSWIWGGCLLMALGGLCAALDARYRKTKTKVAA
ncbi:heme lyase CcmF/NrfE family subunit [Uliginosibacterium sp. 31-16]|uniref:heme lyase CcmF/NrfE family subunit n=1 Tax=Uliginosibacterium sp. 31-16 TaxID=3068315 RepID=UPI00273E827B|nr:heme lyase CcmF/NrfE family subunit [Uliginosibacterium sp. 31-16]MDP5239204.1 heme lyase CcmF/NrfE family subunit [Uliginosibacterium sp. 31-16]